MILLSTHLREKLQRLRFPRAGSSLVWITTNEGGDGALFAKGNGYLRRRALWALILCF